MELMEYLKRAREDGASDVFIVPGDPVTEKCGKDFITLDDEMVKAARSESLIRELYAQARRPIEEFLHSGDDDFSFSSPGARARFRVNTYRQRGSLAAVVRIVPFGIPDWQERHIPPEVMKIADMTHGMVLVTGIAGSGKSTTQACIVDRIHNDSKRRGGHIVTLEDPIEYLHSTTSAKDDGHRLNHCIVSQREISIDSDDYLTALRACLRQAPDVILLGEMRDRETIQAAMTAAETGHLLITTLHTAGAVNAVDRIIDSFPSGQQEQVRAQLSMVLRTVVSQQLLPAVNGGVVPAFEIMHVNDAIRRQIRDNATDQINNVLSHSHEEGMVSMDQAIFELYKSGDISEATAHTYANDSEDMSRWILSLSRG